MTDTTPTTPAIPTPHDPLAVLAAADWFDTLPNGTAYRIAPEWVEWRCGTSGSGGGEGSFADTGLFVLLARLFDLRTGRARFEDDALLVWVPLDRVAQIRQLVTTIGEHPDRWPWRQHDGDRATRTALAARILGIAVATIAEDEDWLTTLGIN